MQPEFQGKDSEHESAMAKCCARHEKTTSTLRSAAPVTWNEPSPLRIRRDTLREQGSFDDRLNALYLRKHNVSRGFYQKLNDFLPFSWQCLDFLFAWCLTYLTLLLTWHSDFEYLHSGWSSSFLCWFKNHNSSFYAQLKIPIGFYWFHDFLLVRVQFKTNMLVNFSHPGAIFMLSDITP